MLISILFSIMEVLIVVVPVLLIVAFTTLAERKTLGSMQRRLGPNIIGYYGFLQPFADALKLLLKENIFPTQSNLVLFFLGPVITLVFSLLGFCVIPFGPGLCILDFDLGILYMLAVSSLSTYGILLAGWSANSKYAFLGSLRSTAQLISYELILSSAILLVILLSGSLSLTTNIENQKAIWYIVPLLPVSIIFFIGCIAETNRAPFDLAEAESELVSGFMTEHAAVIFVFFFLAEYASIVLICILTSILFLGGYLFNFSSFNHLLEIIGIQDSSWELSGDKLEYSKTIFHNHLNITKFDPPIDQDWDSKVYYKINFNNLGIAKPDSLINQHFDNNLGITKPDVYNSLHSYFASNRTTTDFNSTDFSLNNGSFYLISPLFEGYLSSLILGFKSCIMIFIFIWARASFPRIRYDQLMSFCWTILLPLVIAFIILYPCLLNVFSIFVSSNIML